jgi:hypothetical protein
MKLIELHIHNSVLPEGNKFSSQPARDLESQGLGVIFSFRELEKIKGFLSIYMQHSKEDWDVELIEFLCQNQWLNIYNYNFLFLASHYLIMGMLQSANGKLQWSLKYHLLK